MKFHCFLANSISWVKQSPMFFINSCYPQAPAMCHFHNQKLGEHQLSQSYTVILPSSLSTSNLGWKLLWIVELGSISPFLIWKAVFIGIRANLRARQAKNRLKLTIWRPSHRLLNVLQSDSWEGQLTFQKSPHKLNFQQFLNPRSRSLLTLHPLWLQVQQIRKFVIRQKAKL